MKILNIGVGVIGTAYSWQLSEAGNDVYIYVRKGKKTIYEKNGISINCIDYRNKNIKENKLLFHPKIIENFSSDDNFELIIVSLKYNQLKSLLPILKEKAGNADILFLQNNWNGVEEIEKYLKPDQYLHGFCQLLGGNRTETGIDCAICSSKIASTMIGEKNGKISMRLNKIYTLFKKANLNPKISKLIIPWLISHYAMIAALYAGILKSGGSIHLLSNNSKILKETILAMRDGFEVCCAKGIYPKKVSHGLYYLPYFLLIPLLKKIYGKPDMKIIFDGHLNNSPDEIKEMYYNVLNFGIENNVNIPNYKIFEKYFEVL